MISKYNGTCRYCKKPTLKDVDQYDFDNKTSYHTQCEEDAEAEPPSPADYAKAARLGFIQVDLELAADGILRRMLSADRNGSGATVGPNNKARGEQSSLFGVPQKESA